MKMESSTLNTRASRAPAGVSWPAALTALIFVLLLLVPVYASVTDSAYVLLQFSRILVFALAAVGLNLALGYGGLVSFGHAMYIGIGAYCVAIASHYGADSGVLHLLLVVVVTALIAAPVGLIALRTHGIAFIMITLALAQMFYFLAVGLKQYGGDEGLPIQQISRFGDLTGSHVGLYLALLACLGDHQGRFIYTQHDGPITPRQRQNSGRWTLQP